MAPVDSYRSLPCASAYFKQQHVSLGRVLLVVLVAGINQELIAGEALRPVTVLTSLTRRAKVLYRRRNWTRICVQCHRENLPDTRKLRSHKPWRPRPNMALRTSNMRMR